MIIPINHVVEWGYINQRKQTHINEYASRENTTIIDHDYRVGDKFRTKSRSAYKYETPFRGPYEVVQKCTNGTFTLRTGAVTHRVNIRNIKTYNDAIVE